MLQRTKENIFQSLSPVFTTTCAFIAALTPPCLAACLAGCTAGAFEKALLLSTHALWAGIKGREPKDGMQQRVALQVDLQGTQCGESATDQQAMHSAAKALEPPALCSVAEAEMLP